MQDLSSVKPGPLTLGLAVALLGIAAYAQRSYRPPTTVRALYGLKPPTALSAAHTALVLVDFQDEFVRGGLPLPDARPAVASAAQLAAWAHRSGILVVLVQNVIDRPHSPLFRPGSPATAPELAPQPGDLTLQKPTGGAFSRTRLDADLRARGIDTLVVGGFMTHLAVATTASDAAILSRRPSHLGSQLKGA